MKPLRVAAKVYIAVVALLGISILARAMWGWCSEDALRGAFYLMGSILASQLKVRLPGLTGTLSMNFLFVLIGIMELGLPETLTLACAGMAAQILWGNPSRPSVIQVLFNLSAVTLAAAAAWMTYHSTWLARVDSALPILLFFATLVYFLINTLSVSLIIALTENKPLGMVWRQSFLWTAPEYLGGAALAALFHAANMYLGWQMAVLTMPAVYLVYRSYRLYLNRLEEEREHATDIAAMHWRTIEALAMAIDAKDNTTHAHLQRVLVYATEIGKEMRLCETEQRALEMASLLHDIGKVAVPDHILSKPARLTPEEFERMKIHPVVGAEILERVGFPYPVVPIVRAHHEKWDGTGYPLGLKGEAIPLGARILAAVDCLDALSSARQYRRAMPLDLAMEKVVAESGKSFDPRVVEVLRRRHAELESVVRSIPPAASHFSLTPKCSTGGAPGAGYEIERWDPDTGEPKEQRTDLRIEDARREFQNLLDLMRQNDGGGLSREEVFSLSAALLRDLAPHHTLAFYACRNQVLIPEYVSGEESRLFSSLRIPMGKGISGWVLERRKAILNGDPAVESHYLQDSWKTDSLRAAMAVPLPGPTGMVGVLTLCHREPDHFTWEELRILLSVSWQIGHVFHHALRLDSAGATPVERELPPRRLFCHHLERELSRSRRTQASLAVLAFQVQGWEAVRQREGHLMAERLLHAAVHGIRQHCREYDYPSRTGDDRLAVILPGLSRQGCRTRLPELQAAALGEMLKLCDISGISVQGAAAIFPEDAEEADALLEIAEHDILRSAQKSGRIHGPGTENLATRVVQ
jgi:diguanylate cyclase (GGDEF)-like protein/putative nucleotidyltransferase with HDIG domain